MSILREIETEALRPETTAEFGRALVFDGPATSSGEWWQCWEGCAELSAGRQWVGFVQASGGNPEIREMEREPGTEIVIPVDCELVQVVEYAEGAVLEEEGLTVSALRVEHPPVTDCFALRFDHAAGSVVFSSDTAFFPPLADFAKGASILVHEAMLAEGIERLVARTGNGERLREHLLASHTFAAEAGRIATEAGAGRLVLNHLIPADDPQISAADWERAVRETWSGPLTVAADGLAVPLAEEKRRSNEARQPT